MTTRRSKKSSPRRSERAGARSPDMGLEELDEEVHAPTRALRPCRHPCCGHSPCPPRPPQTRFARTSPRRPPDKIAAESRERFRAYGPDFADTPTRVFRLEDGSAVVVPAGYKLNDIDLRRDGSIRLTTAEPATTSDAATDSDFAAAAASWSLKSHNCFARTTIRTPNGNAGGFMDTCYEIHKLAGETDTTYDYWNITYVGDGRCDTRQHDRRLRVDPRRPRRRGNVGVGRLEPARRHQ